MDARADVLVLGRYADPTRPAPEMVALDKKLDGLLSTVLATEKFEGKAGQVAHFYTGGRIPAGRVMVVGLGPKKSGDAESVRRAASTGARRARDLGAQSVAVFMPANGCPPAPARRRSSRAASSARTSSTGTKEKSDKVVESLAVVEPDRRQQRAAREGARVGEVWAAATCLARDLVNEPANDVTPSSLVERAEELARGRRHQREGARAGGLREARHGRVSRRGAGQPAAAEVHPSHVHAEGQAAPPRRRDRQGHHVRLGRARPEDRRRHAPHEGRHVGRGRRARHLAGAAHSSAARRGARPDRRHREHAVGHRAAAGRHRARDERAHDRDRQHGRRGPAHPRGRARIRREGDRAGRDDRHGDAHRGDASSRSACGVSGLFASHDGLAVRLLAAAGAAGERMWQMPLHRRVQGAAQERRRRPEQHVGQRGGGAITAGSSCASSPRGIPWAHLDIAGPAFTERGPPLGPKGATGVAVRTVLGYLTALGGKS